MGTLDGVSSAHSLILTGTHLRENTLDNIFSLRFQYRYHVYEPNKLDLAP